MTEDTKKMIARLTIVTMLAGGSLYEIQRNKKAYKVDEPLQKVIEVFDDATILDEAVDERIAMYGDMSIVDASDKLEEAIEIIEMLNSYDFSEVKKLDKLTKEECEFAKTLTKEDVTILLQLIDSDKDSLEFEEQKLKAFKILYFVKCEKEEFVKKNGRKIVLNTLAWTIKSSVAEEFGLSVDEIKDVEIPSSKKIKDMKLYVVYDGKEYYAPKDSSAVFDSLYYIYQIKSTTDYQGQEFRLYKDALNSVKVLTMTGVNLENNELVNDITIKDAKKVLKK